MPIAADGMATEGVVVAGIGRARMVDDPVELVVARGGRGGDPWRQVRRHVQVAQGKVHVGVQFPESLTRTESFQICNQHQRQIHIYYLSKFKGSRGQGVKGSKVTHGARGSAGTCGWKTSWCICAESDTWSTSAIQLTFG